MQSANFDGIESDFNICFILASMPGYVYWKDLNSVYRGCNINLAKISNLESPSDIVGKTDFDFEWGKLKVNEFIEQDRYVIKTGKIHVEEHDLPFENEVRNFRAEKRPLIGKSGKVIGIFGFSIDITAEKTVEQLRLENERQQTALLEEQKKLISLAHKVAHDITSPLSALNMVVQMCDELPEKKLSLLKGASESILDIANNLIDSYRKTDSLPVSGIEPRLLLLVSDLLMQLVSEKKVQYQHHPVTFETYFTNDAHFAFIHIQKTEFRRTMSNLINNAVDALESKEGGKIVIQLIADGDSVIVKVQDNGKGMPRDKAEKILEHQSFTEGKENGHGLGLQQVWDTLEYNQGTMAIQSDPGKGTSIQLAFPRIVTSSWIAQEIHLIPNSIIVILDDDVSIHAAWNVRFTPFLTSHPALQLHHFTQGQEVLDFLESLNPEEKDRVVFLSDYELLHQNRNGLQIIEASAIERTMLVTSYYANHKVQETANHLHIKILPKQMASVIQVYMDSDNAVDHQRLRIVKAAGNK